MVAEAVAARSVLRALNIPKVAEGQIQRLLTSTAGRVREVAGPAQFPGARLFVPAGEGAHPGVVLLHGAESGEAGWTNLTAIRLADSGKAAMTLPYYGVPGTPMQLAEVPLDYTLDAARWFKQSPYVAGHDLGFYGQSRGAEQTLLLASLDQENLINAAAIHSANRRINSSFDPFNRGAPVVRDGQEVAPYTYRGEAIETGPQPLENISIPFHISHSLNDERWPVENAFWVARDLGEAGNPVELSVVPNEPHMFRRAARELAEDKYVQFFDQHLS